MLVRQIIKLRRNLLVLFSFYVTLVTFRWTYNIPDTFARQQTESQHLCKSANTIHAVGQSWHVIVNRQASQDLSFEDTMKKFPWPHYKQAIYLNDTTKIQSYSTLLLLKLLPFVRKPPALPINKFCNPPHFQIPLSPTCKSLPRPRKVGLLWQLGFDVDALEIHLNEMNNLVDKFFLIESVQAHSSYLTEIKKPLLWERLKYDERFANFSHKIVHFIVDDASLSSVNRENMWSQEHLQDELRWRKFLEWNNSTKYFQKSDLIGFGDIDEVPYWGNVFHMKNCKLPSDPVDIGIWFPFDGLNTILISDFPVRNHNFTFGEPTFWTVGKAIQYSELSEKPPTKLSGKSFKYLLGGMHLSRYAFPPFQMIKMLTKTSAKIERSLERIIKVGMLYASGKHKDAEDELNYIPYRLSRRLYNLEKFIEQNKTEASNIVRVPWFLNCNQERYPSFNKERDFRLDLPMPYENY